MNDAEKLLELFEALKLAESKNDNSEMQKVVESARRIDGRESIAWHSSSLNSEERKWFTAWVYQKKPIPKALARPFIAAALRTNDASRNRCFIDPVLETYGNDFTLSVLAEESKVEGIAPDAIEKARYWAERPPRNSRGTTASQT